MEIIKPKCVPTLPGIMQDPMFDELYANEETEDSDTLLKRGIKEASQGLGEYLGSFAQYANLEIED